MNILHLSALPVWPIEGKGGMPSLLETLRGHVRGGHRVVILVPRYQLFKDTPLEVSVDAAEPFDAHIVSCRWAPALMGVRRFCLRLGGGQELPYILRWILNASMYCLLTFSLTIAGLRLRLRDGFQPELVYANNQYAALAGWIVATFFRTPNVTRLYGTFLADLMRRRWVTLRYPTAAAGYWVPHSLLICGNDGTRGDEVARKFGINLDKFRFWQNGVDLPSKPTQTSRQNLISRFSDDNLRLQCTWVISCSRLSYWKRIDRMIRALQVAIDSGCDCRLVVLGSGPEGDRLKALATELNVDSNIIWLGAVEHDTIWEFMNCADAFMITNDVTNRCNPVYESICAGLPVISVRDKSTSDLLIDGENALLSEKDDNESLGQNLARICTDRDLAESMRHAQSKYRKKLWSWKTRMETEVAELERLVYKKKAPQTSTSDGRVSKK